MKICQPDGGLYQGNAVVVLYKLQIRMMCTSFSPLQDLQAIFCEIEWQWTL